LSESISLGSPFGSEYHLRVSILQLKQFIGAGGVRFFLTIVGFLVAASVARSDDPATNPALPGPSGTETTLSLLHTNDLHSQYRPQLDSLGLGGISRLKTLVSRLRSESRNSALVDAGDWSEGSIYYNQGAGVESLRMMEKVGYDLALVGNHDWLNGPDHLLRSAEVAHPAFQMIAGNFDLSAYPKAAEFRKWVEPYVIREYDGVKVAFIGVATYEFVFDSYLNPIKILNPYTYVRELSARLRDQADVIVAISHNGIKTNQNILRAAPNVDLVIGAHDHIQLNQPISVPRPGASDGLIFEALCWGQYLGHVDLKIRTRAFALASGLPRVVLSSYKLHPVNSRIPEDPEIQKLLQELESTLERQYGPIFEEKVGHSHIRLNRKGAENRMGNLAADSYLASTGADFALEQSSFIYGELHPGEIRTVDVYNSNPAIHNPITGKSWTVHTFELTGKTLRWLLTVLFSHPTLAQFGVLSQSGMEIIYDPALQSPPAPSSLNLPVPAEAQGTSDKVLKRVRIQGQALDPGRTYKVAASGGILASLDFLNSLIPGAVPMGRLRDTGQEAWRVMADRIRAVSPLRSTSVPTGTRIRSLGPDLSIFDEDIQLLDARKLPGGGLQGTLQATVRNFGANASQSGVMLTLYGHRNGMDTSRDPELRDIGASVALPAIDPLSEQTYRWAVQLPAREDEPLVPVSAQIGPVTDEVNLSNNQVTRWLSLKGPR